MKVDKFVQVDPNRIPSLPSVLSSTRMNPIISSKSLAVGFYILLLATLISGVQSDSPGALIVGGIEATPNEFPFIVDLRRTPDLHWCGGSIISPEWIVAAAQCIRCSSPYTFFAVAGDHDIQGIEGAEQRRDVVEVLCHGNYSGAANDMALLRVFPPFHFNEYVQPINISQPGFEMTETGVIAGWGTESEASNDMSRVLRKVEVPHVNNTVCSAVYPGSIVDSMACYGQAGRDACAGDAGGPLLCPNGNGSLLCGIISTGNGCGREGYPGVYTRLSHFTEWITQHTSPTLEDTQPFSNITSCSGYVETTSGTITLRNIRRGQQCVWTVKTMYDKIRLRLGQSSLLSNDELGITMIVSGDQEEVQSNYTRLSQVTTEGLTRYGSLMLITFTASDDEQDREFSLEFYSSGFPYPTRLTGLASLDTSYPGQYSYPVGGGQYGNWERVVMVLAPIQGNPPSSNLTVTFTEIDVPSYNCFFASVTAYALEKDGAGFREVGTYCGSDVPSALEVDGRVALLIFKVESSETGTGFKFLYE